MILALWLLSLLTIGGITATLLYSVRAADTLADLSAPTAPPPEHQQPMLSEPVLPQPLIWL